MYVNLGIRICHILTIFTDIERSTNIKRLRRMWDLFPTLNIPTDIERSTDIERLRRICYFPPSK